MYSLKTEESKQPLRQNASDPDTCQDESSLAIQTRFFIPPHVQILLPGLILTSIISALALHTGDKITYVTPLIAAMGMGILLRNAFIIPDAYKAGIFFSMRQILRVAVALLGVRITFDKIIGLGWEGLVISLVPLVLTLFGAVGIGRVLNVAPMSALLIGTGTSICGAAAVLTTGAVARAKDEDVIVAISSITVFGTISMLAYPLIFQFGLLPLSPEQYGYWAGASIHEVAQVITAAFSGGDESGEIGIIIKLTRVAALIPVALVISMLVARGAVQPGGGAEKTGVAFPFFLLGFLGMVALNSVDFFTPKAVRWIELFDMILLTMAMAGMGLETDFRQLLRVGFRPFFLSVFVTVLISTASLLLVLWLA